MILALLQARMSSTRLPGKVLQPILGKPMLQCQLERLSRVKSFDKLVVVTSVETIDNVLQRFCDSMSVPCFRGSLDDVLDRFYKAALAYAPDHVVRLTGDCPLIDPELIDRVIDFHLAGGYDYSSNCLEPTFPDGLDVEIVRFGALERAWHEAVLPSQREHVTLFINKQPDLFRVGTLKATENFSHLRWTVDNPADLEFVRHVYEGLYPANPCFTTADILGFLHAQPERNAHLRSNARNEGLSKSFLKDEVFLQTEGKDVRTV